MYEYELNISYYLLVKGFFGKNTKWRIDGKLNLVKYIFIGAYSLFRSKKLPSEV